MISNLNIETSVEYIERTEEKNAGQHQDYKNNSKNKIRKTSIWTTLNIHTHIKNQ